MPIIVRKNVHSVKNTVLSYHFFIFFMKTPCVYAHILWKNINSIKRLYIYYWTKKSRGCSFFSDFSQENHSSHAHILLKNVHSLKNTALMPIFRQKTSILWKQCSHVIFFQFFMKNPCCHAHIRLCACAPSPTPIPAVANLCTCSPKRLPLASLCAFRSTRRPLPSLPVANLCVHAPTHLPSPPLLPSAG